MNESQHPFPIQKWDSQNLIKTTDHLASEEPLQVIIDGRPLAVLMRTPGQDHHLVMGFLFTEAIISQKNHVQKIDLEAKDNHALVFLADDHSVDWNRLTRHLFSASSCGLCGKATVDAILQNHPPIQSDFSLPIKKLLSAPDAMRKAQETFSSTGGLHASGIFDQNQNLLILHEDIGRHNALDKVIGQALSENLDLSSCFLLLSGRISFELMQKSLAAQIPLIAGISAPSSLAAQFATESNQTLVGFLRPPTFNIYHGGQRLKESL